jgi:hypothetical protein
MRGFVLLRSIIESKFIILFALSYKEEEQIKHAKGI